MDIAKVGESKPDREQPKPTPRRRARTNVPKEPAPKKDEPPDDGDARRIDVVA